MVDGARTTQKGPVLATSSHPLGAKVDAPIGMSAGYRVEVAGAMYGKSALLRLDLSRILVWEVVD